MTVASKPTARKYDFLELELRESALLITVSNPQALNALSPAVIEELREVFSQLRQQLGASTAAGEPDWSVRGVIITGAGEKSFIAGADIAAMQTMTPEQAAIYAAAAQELTEWFAQLPVPVIAAVNGYALGGGCEIALACDYIYATENAVFAQPEVGLGLIPGFGGTVRLFRYVGAGLAREMIYTGKRISATQAHRAGLVTEVFATQEQLLAAAVASVQLAAKQSPRAIAQAKETMAAVENLSIRAGLAHECSNFAAIFGTPDMLEGTAAFVQKRRPEFTGA